MHYKVFGFSLTKCSCAKFSVILPCFHFVRLYRPDRWFLVQYCVKVFFPDLQSFALLLFFSLPFVLFTVLLFSPVKVLTIRYNSPIRPFSATLSHCVPSCLFMPVVFSFLLLDLSLLPLLNFCLTLFERVLLSCSFRCLLSSTQPRFPGSLPFCCSFVQHFLLLSSLPGLGIFSDLDVVFDVCLFVCQRFAYRILFDCFLSLGFLSTSAGYYPPQGSGRFLCLHSS